MKLIQTLVLLICTLISISAVGNIPSGSFWTLEETRKTQIKLLSPPLITPDDSIFLDVTFSLTKCQFPGPIQQKYESVDEIAITALIWQKHSTKCDNNPHTSQKITRHFRIKLSEGKWKLRGGKDKDYLVVEVKGRPAESWGELMPYDKCSSDADCWVNYLCVPLKDQSKSKGVCASPCSDELDCPGSCDSSKTLIGICSKVNTSQCKEDSDCPLQRSCQKVGDVGHCGFNSKLNQRTRRTCKVNTDCTSDMMCVYQTQDESSGTCEMPCTSHWMICPNTHTCGPGRISNQKGPVCEWVGE